MKFGRVKALFAALLIVAAIAVPSIAVSADHTRPPAGYSIQFPISIDSSADAQ